MCRDGDVYGTKMAYDQAACTDRLRFNAQGLVQEMKIYMDASPLFAPAAS